MSYHPKLSAGIDFSELEKDFFETQCFNSGNMDIIRVELFDFFDGKSYEEIKPYLKTYWRLYVYGTWKYLGTTGEAVVQKAIEQQTPEAIRLGFDVFDRLMWYMQTRMTLPEEIERFFSKAKDSFTKSEWVIGQLGGQDVTIRNVIDEIALLDSRRGETLLLAQFYERMQKLFFPKGLNEDIYQKQYTFVEIDEAVMKFVELVRFFVNTPAEEMPDLVFVYTNPSTFVPDSPGGDTVTTKVTGVRNSTPVEKPKMPIETRSSSVAMQTNAKPRENAPVITKQTAPVPPKLEAPKKIEQTIAVPKPPAPAKPSYAEIKKKIEAVFPKNAQGEYVDLDSVLTALQSAAMKYNDQKIAELMYFDEADNKFKWSV